MFEVRNMSGVKNAISNSTLASLKQLNYSMMRTAIFTTDVPVFLVSILAGVISELFDTSNRNDMLWTKDYTLSNVCIQHDPKSQVQPYSAYDRGRLKRHNKAVLAKKK